MIICYTVPEIWLLPHNFFFFSFWAIFCSLTPLKTQKIKISKNEQNSWTYHHLTHVYQKLSLDNVQFLKYGAQQTDKQTDRWIDRKSDI